MTKYQYSNLVTDSKWQSYEDISKAATFCSAWFSSFDSSTFIMIFHNK